MDMNRFHANVRAELDRADERDRPGAPKKKQPNVIDLTDEEEHEQPEQPAAPAPLRGNAPSSQSRRPAPGPGPKPSQDQTKARNTGAKSAPPAPQPKEREIVDLDPDLSETNSAHARSKQQSKSSPSKKHPLTGSSKARSGYVSDSGEGSSSRQLPRISEAPPSQVQIPRTLKSVSNPPPPTNSVAGGLNPTNQMSKKRPRPREDGVDAGTGLAGKKVKYTQGQNPRKTSQPPKSRSSATQSVSHGPGHHNSIPIDLTDSPPPETRPVRRESHSLPDRQRTPKPSEVFRTQAAGEPPTTSSSTTKDGAQNSRDAIDSDLNRIIPESPPEKSGSPVVTAPKQAQQSVPASIRPSTENNDRSLNMGLPTSERINPSSDEERQILQPQRDRPNISDRYPVLLPTPEGLDKGPNFSGGLPVPLGSEEGLKDRRMMRMPSAPKGTSPSKEDKRKVENGVTLSNDIEAPALPDLPTVTTNLPSAGSEPSGVNDASLPDQTRPSAPPDLPAMTPIQPPSSPIKISPANHVEQVVGKYVQELRGDNEYWTRMAFKEARYMAKEPKWSGHPPTSVFRDMAPIQPILASEGKRTSYFQAMFTVEKFNSGNSKSTKRTWIVPCTMYHSPTATDVPTYSHFVSIKQSFLGPNQNVLQHMPYFSDTFDMSQAPGIKQRYHLDYHERERKLKRLAQAENYAPYVEDMLIDVDTNWAALLQFYLDPQPDVGANADARAALRDREQFCQEDFMRGGERWTTVFSKLPLNEDPDRVGRAALLCEYFQKIAKFPFWHMVKRSDYTTQLLKEESPELDLDEMTCRVCMRFNCPYHGEIFEHKTSLDDHEDDEAGPLSTSDAVVMTDIIHPWKINFRSRVGLLPSVESDPPGTVIDPKQRKVEFWHRRNLLWEAEDRGPFYPCYHPGTSCEKADCSCFRDKVVCEKTCGCPPSCKRKFQGCDCKRRGGKKVICHQDQKCACFKFDRECDPDLCGDCGVVDVLDYAHRHDENILIGRCHNASIQRGIPKHTILGDSGIHGFGLYTCEDIREHEFLGEYKGEIITDNEAERRGVAYDVQKLSYLFTLNKRQGVDSKDFGNKIRFINHGNEKRGSDKGPANLYPRVVMANTVFRIALYGRRKVVAGEELLFDYGDKFPKDQLGITERKAAPVAHNKKLIAQFDDVEEFGDKYGNRRVRISGNKDTFKGLSDGSAAQAGGTGSGIARKSGLRPAVGRSKLGRTRSDNIPDPGDAEDEAQNLSDDDEELPSSERRLLEYNVADDDEEDASFAPQHESSERSSDDRFEETSSIDGDAEDEDDEDEDEEMEDAPPRRPTRSSRRGLQNGDQCRPA